MKKKEIYRQRSPPFKAPDFSLSFLSFSVSFSLPLSILLSTIHSEECSLFSFLNDKGHSILLSGNLTDSNERSLVIQATSDKNLGVKINRYWEEN